jgi:hypothetical protein
LLQADNLHLFVVIARSQTSGHRNQSRLPSIATTVRAGMGLGPRIPVDIERLRRLLKDSRQEQILCRTLCSVLRPRRSSRPANNNHLRR